jgi:hypothetical protein
VTLMLLSCDFFVIPMGVECGFFVTPIRSACDRHTLAWDVPHENFNFTDRR